MGSKAKKRKRQKKIHWNIKSAEKEFQRNKNLVTSGETFRSQKESSWQLGKSPSNTRSRYV